MRSMLLMIYFLSALVAGLLADPALARRTNVYAPLNDNFQMATTIRPEVGLHPASLRNASRQVNEPKISSTSVGRTIWYKYTATRTGRAVVAVTTGALPLARFQMAVYRGNALTSLKKLGSVDVGGSTVADTSGAVAFDTVQNTVYRIQVDTVKGTDSRIDFFIGLAQFGGGGGLGVFQQKPVIIVANREDSNLMLVANALKSAADISVTIPGLEEYLVFGPTNATLPVSDTASILIYDNDDAYGASPGTFESALTIVASATKSATILTTAKVPVYRIVPTYGGKAELVARFHSLVLGARSDWPAGTTVTIKNKSTTAASSDCRFGSASDQDRMSMVLFGEILSNGTLANFNKPFSFAAGQIRTFKIIYAISASSNDNLSQEGTGPLYFECPGLNALGEYFSIAPQYGYSSQLKIDPLGVNELREIGIPLVTFGRKVVVKLTNTGEYAGNFAITVTDTPKNKLADVTAVCESTATGVCIDTPDSSNLNVIMGVGEVVYLTLTVDRGLVQGQGQIDIAAVSTDSSSSYANARAALARFYVVTP